MNWPAHPAAGVCLHLTSLPGRFGIGELGKAAFDFIDNLNAMGVGVWQFLPLGPTAYADSPYQPLCSFAGNTMLIDIGELISLGLLHNNEVRELTELPARSVDYGRLLPLKTRLLNLAASRFPSYAGAELKSDYDRFRERHDATWLHRYALFRVLKSAHGERAWPRWEAALARREPTALREAEHRYEAAIEAEKIAQFLFRRQWRALQDHARAQGVSLFGDVPIYIALDSADAWALREIVLLDDYGRPQAVAGVPPDYYSADGQLWGNPIYDWTYHESTGYQWWIKRFGHTIDMMDLVRVDHFRGFEAFWSVPFGAGTAREGEWVSGPGDRIFEALRAALPGLPIVAEDLGVITPPVEALRDGHNIPGMVVLQFDAVEPGFDPSTIGEHCVCYTGTHDNDTTVGWFNGGPGDTRSSDEIRAQQQAVLQVTGGSPETIHLDMIRLAFDTAARIAMVPMQDYLGLGSEARMNTPGTEADNWCWRLRADDLTPAVIEHIGAMVSDAGRAA